MKKLSFLIAMLVSFLTDAQNFPYLNASTGNPDFFTDTDTNMYLIHGNRLVKSDKNFQTVWANTYGNIDIKNVLLSKTGSMYFIAAGSSTASTTIIGKIAPNGTIVWAKSTHGMIMQTPNSGTIVATLNPDNFFMDSNNQLILSGRFSGGGNAAFLKLDTKGNFIMGRSFQLNNFSSNGYLQYVNVLNESSGQINIVAQGVRSSLFYGIDLQTFSYSINGDSLVTSKRISLAGCSNCTQSFDFKFYKSKTRSDVFYLMGHIYTSPSPFIPYHFHLGKFDMTSNIWSRGYRWSGAPATVGSKLDEDVNGNTIAVINTLNSLTNHHSGFIKFDSSGTTNGNWQKYFNGYSGGGSNYPDDRVNVIHPDKFLINVAGAGFPSNPLTTEVITSSLVACAPSVSLVYVSSGGVQSYFSETKPAQYTFSISGWNLFAVSTSSVSGFSFANNFCTLMNISQTDLNDEFKIFPNPVSEKLEIANQNLAINSVQIFDVNGKEIVNEKNKNEIEVSGLPTGIYLIKIQTGKGFVTKKFLKE